MKDSSVHFHKNSNFVLQLFENGRIISQVNCKDYELKNDMFFQWAQLKHKFPKRWKKLIFKHIDVRL